MKRILKILFFSTLFIFAAFHAEGGEKRLTSVSFIPQWVPQAQFAGYYIAYEKGIYNKYGLDVAIINGGPNHQPCDFLESRRADFATLWLSTGIQRRAQGIPYVNIGQIIQKSALMLVAKKSSGIIRPEDINNKRVGLWGEIFQIQPLTFFKKYNLHVRVVPQSLSINLFLRGGVDVASAMWYNEYHTIINSGYNPEELTTFFFHDYGLNFPEDGIYMLEERFKKNPAAAHAFVKASLEGWAYAFDHPEEALDIILKYMEEAYIPANRMHQKWMLSRMKDLILVNEKEGCVGRLNAKDYHMVARALKENDIIDRIPSFTDFYKDCLADKK